MSRGVRSLSQRALLAMCASGLGACSAASSSPGVSDAGDADADLAVDGSTDVPPTYAPTYGAVWDEILSPTCALVFCHAGSTDFLLLTSKSVGYGSLVGASAAGPSCGPTGLKRVEPGHPETSLMYLKVTSPPCGSKMPLDYGDRSLEPRQLQQIHDWIAAGALDD